jgi:CRP-like cAMP-binding protein
MREDKNMPHCSIRDRLRFMGGDTVSLDAIFPRYALAATGGTQVLFAGRFRRFNPVKRRIILARRDVRTVQSGERTNSHGKPVSNKILLAIPDGEFLSIRAHLEFVELPAHQVLHEPNESLRFVYFPNGGLLSLVVVMEGGETVEAGIVGKEGIAGIPSAVGLRRNPLREVVQIAGDGFKIKIDAWQDTLQSAPQLQMMLSRYAVLHCLQVSQTAACNRLHRSEQRLARWLLMAQDRVDAGVLSITHDFLATMLGTDRPTITLAAGILQKKKLIEYPRGTVKILDREKLERSACECYGIIQQLNGELGLK